VDAQLALAPHAVRVDPIDVATLIASTLMVDGR
jgi:hypothetical protein